MICIVAPYSPAQVSATPNLGAARKIEAVVKILAGLDSDLVLVNTSHDGQRRAPLSVRAQSIGGVDLQVITPPIHPQRTLGKLLNLLEVRDVVAQVLRIGRPNLVWLYNGYAFESLFGRQIARLAATPIVQEMEDWHFSRGRGINPKPLADWVAWRRLGRHVAHFFAVNHSLASKCAIFPGSRSLFPGVVGDDLAQVEQLRPPFSGPAGRKPVVGYFGGLSGEKGADLVLSLIAQHADRFDFIVSGAGALAPQFQAAAAAQPALRFVGTVAASALPGLMAECDVLLNPHRPVARMGNGIFPFKVVESVATGRLVVSTDLPAAGLEDVLQGVVMATASTDAFVAAIQAAPATYARNNAAIQAGRAAAVRRFGIDAVRKTVADRFAWRTSVGGHARV